MEIEFKIIPWKIKILPISVRYRAELKIIHFSSHLHFSGLCLRKMKDFWTPCIYNSLDKSYSLSYTSSDRMLHPRFFSYFGIFFHFAFSEENAVLRKGELQLLSVNNWFYILLMCLQHSFSSKLLYFLMNIIKYQEVKCFEGGHGSSF